MPKPLPTKLGKEPLVEAVCELRVSPAGALHTVLPGYLFAKFRDEIGATESLPAGMIPEVVRAQDPDLAYASIVRLEWRKYFVLIGSRSIAIACRLPYPKWPQFRTDALALFHSVLQSSLVRGIDRYSVKYVNFFPSADGKTGFTEMMDWSLRIGELTVARERTQLRVEVPSGDVVTVLTISSPAQVTGPHEPAKLGGVVDVDTVCNYVTNDVAAFDTELEVRLNHVRQINKQAFFDCLTQKSIDLMEPEYADTGQLSRPLH
jgi:uncharacterized protein (TIGR04255 family)